MLQASIRVVTSNSTLRPTQLRTLFGSSLSRISLRTVPYRTRTAETSKNSTGHNLLCDMQRRIITHPIDPIYVLGFHRPLLSLLLP